MPSHLKSVVAPSMDGSLGLFVAAQEPCIGMAAEPPAKGRLSRRTTPGDLVGEPLQLPRSYAIAVVLCPGDGTDDVAALARRLSIPAERFYFFYAKGTNLRAAFAAWQEAGLEVPYSSQVDDWKALNRRFGAFWNAWVHDDHCRLPGCRMR